jgi:hypothetical protein
LAVSTSKAYDNEKARQQIKDEGALAGHTQPLQFHQNSSLSKISTSSATRIENVFCRTKGWRLIATRHDMLALNFLSAVLMIGTLYWIKFMSPHLSLTCPSV